MQCPECWWCCCGCSSSLMDIGLKSHGVCVELHVTTMSSVVLFVPFDLPLFATDELGLMRVGKNQRENGQFNLKVYFEHAQFTLSIFRYHHAPNERFIRFNGENGVERRTKKKNGNWLTQLVWRAKTFSHPCFRTWFVVPRCWCLMCINNGCVAGRPSPMALKTFCPRMNINLNDNPWINLWSKLDMKKHHIDQLWLWRRRWRRRSLYCAPHRIQ